MDVQRSRFIFKLVSTYCPDLLIDWHYNEAHHGKELMGGIGGTIKTVFHQVKSDQIIINSAEDFCKAANQFCPSIAMLLQKSDVILSETSDIEEAPIIPETLKIHKFTRCSPLQSEKPKSVFPYYRKARNLFVHKNTPPKKHAVT